MGLVSNTTAKLTSAVSSLPILLERKRLLDMHTTLATGEIHSLCVLTESNRLIFDWKNKFSHFGANQTEETGRPTRSGGESYEQKRLGPIRIGYHQRCRMRNARR